MSKKLSELREQILAWSFWPAWTRKLLEHWLTASFIRYLVIGISTFLLQIGLLYIINQLLGVEKVQANLISTLLCLTFNFGFSNFWTFKTDKSSGHAKKIVKYLIIAAFNYVFDTLLAFPFLTLTLLMNQYLAKILITGLIVLWNFFLYKFWVFKESPDEIIKHSD